MSRRSKINPIEKVKQLIDTLIERVECVKQARNSEMLKQPVRYLEHYILYK